MTQEIEEAQNARERLKSIVSKVLATSLERTLKPEELDHYKEEIIHYRNALQSEIDALSLEITTCREMLGRAAEILTLIQDWHQRNTMPIYDEHEEEDQLPF